MLEDISAILSSKARWLVLNLLCQSEGELGVRDIESLSELNVRSVQLALGSLYKQKLIRKKKVKNRVLYRANTEHTYYRVLNKIFALLNKEELRSQSSYYTKKAKKALEFCEQAFQLQGKVK